MKRRLIKEFNKLYFKNIPTAKVALTLYSTVSDFNRKSAECSQYKPALNILSDLLQVEQGSIIKPYSETLSDIVWDLSEANVIFKRAYVNFPNSVKLLCGELNFLSNNACFVGGCVRDILCDKEPKDFDFVTDTPYDTLKRHFEKAGYTVQEKGEQFLVLILSKGNEQFEIANYRKDGTYTDGRRPDSVDIGTIMDDTMRRDLTVNAGYVNTKTLKVQDPGGYFIDDINNRTLRFIGKPKDRLQEDPIRAIRFYRFISKGFKPDKKSLQAVRERVQNDSKRINELQNILKLPGVAEIVDKEINKRGDKMGGAKPRVNTSVYELSKTLLSFERTRLEIEKMTGL